MWANFLPRRWRLKPQRLESNLYVAGEKEDRHYHKVATEVTLILSGRVRMNGTEHGSGEIVVIEPMESTDFEALEDTTTVMVKVPGALNDKYMGKPPP